MSLAREEMMNIKSMIKNMDDQLEELKALTDVTIKDINEINLNIKEKLTDYSLEDISNLSEDDIVEMIQSLDDGKSYEKFVEHWRNSKDEDITKGQFGRNLLTEIKKSLLQIAKFEMDRDKLQEDYDTVSNNYFKYINSKEYKEKKLAQYEEMRQKAEQETDPIAKNKILDMIETMTKSENLMFLYNRINERGEKEIQKLTDDYFNESKSAYILKRFKDRLPHFGYNPQLYLKLLNLEEMFLPEEYHNLNNIFLFVCVATIAYMDRYEKRDQMYCTSLLLKLVNLVYHQFGDDDAEKDFIDFIKKFDDQFMPYIEKFKADNVTAPNHPVRIAKNKEIEQQKKDYVCKKLDELQVDYDIEKSASELSELLLKVEEEKLAETKAKLKSQIDEMEASESDEEDEDDSDSNDNSDISEDDYNESDDDIDDIEDSEETEDGDEVINDDEEAEGEGSQNLSSEDDMDDSIVEDDEETSMEEEVDESPIERSFNSVENNNSNVELVSVDDSSNKESMINSYNAEFHPGPDYNWHPNNKEAYEATNQDIIEVSEEVAEKLGDGLLAIDDYQIPDEVAEQLREGTEVVDIDELNMTEIDDEDETEDSSSEDDDIPDDVGPIAVTATDDEGEAVYTNGNDDGKDVPETVITPSIGPKSPFDEDHMKRIISGLKTPMKIIPVMNGDNSYEIKVYEELDPGIQYLVSIDSYANISIDQSVMIVIDPYTRHVVADMETNDMKMEEFNAMINYFVMTYTPNGIIIGGRESVGILALKTLSESSIGNRVYWEYDDNDEHARLWGVRSAKFKQTTPNMMDVLMDRAYLHETDFTSKMIINDLKKLVVKENGKVGPASGASVALSAYLRALCLLATDNNLGEFGLNIDYEITKDLDSDMKAQNPPTEEEFNAVMAKMEESPIMEELEKLQEEVSNELLTDEQRNAIPSDTGTNPTSTEDHTNEETEDPKVEDHEIESVNINSGIIALDAETREPIKFSDGPIHPVEHVITASNDMVVTKAVEAELPEETNDTNEPSMVVQVQPAPPSTNETPKTLVEVLSDIDGWYYKKDASCDTYSYYDNTNTLVESGISEVTILQLMSTGSLTKKMISL